MSEGNPRAQSDEKEHFAVGGKDFQEGRRGFEYLKDHNPHTAAGHRADIQGLRAVAVALVVAFHAGLPLSGGFIGVDMFFVISGFVITAMLMRQFARDGKLSLGSFYVRRIRRLLPALSVLLVFVAVASTLLLNPYGTQQIAAKTSLAATLISANLYLSQLPGGYFDLSASTNPLLHTWSLSVEEQFYLVFPALLAATWALGRRLAPRGSLRTTTLAVIIVTIGSFVVALATSHGSNSGGTSAGSFAFYSPVTRAWEFGVGALLSLGAVTMARLGRRISWALGLVGLALIAFAAWTFDGSTPFPGVAALVPVIGTALIIVAGMEGRVRGVAAALSVGPAVWIGDVSYGWYLWHWPLIVFAAALWPRNSAVLVAAALVALVPTVLSFRFVENPFRSDNRLSGRRILPLAAACIAVPILAALGLVAVNRLEKRTGAVAAYAAATADHIYGKMGCHASTLDPRSACTWPVANPKGSIVLIGDSNAGQFTEPVARAGNQLGYNVTVGSVGGCMFVDIIRESSITSGPSACRQFVIDSLATMTQSPPDLVILAESTSSTLAPSNPEHFMDPRSGKVSATFDERAAIFENGVKSVLDQLAAVGTPTLFVHTIPNLPNVWNARTCPALRIYLDSCGISIDRVAVEQQQRPARDAEKRAVGRATLASSVDFTADLCSTDRCYAQRNNVWIYRDATHLSVDGALTLTNRFQTLIGDNVRKR